MIYLIIALIIIYLATMKPTLTLKKVLPVGTWYGHFYLDKKGDRQFLEVTQQEYESGVIQVPGTYVGGGCLTKFDTPSGFIEDNCYFQDGTSQVVKLSGKTIEPVKSGSVVNNTFTDAR